MREPEVSETRGALRCHWWEDPSGDRFLVPGCMTRVDNPDIDGCDCPTVEAELKAALEELAALRTKLASAQEWGGYVAQAVHSHRDGTAIMRKAADLADAHEQAKRRACDDRPAATSPEATPGEPSDVGAERNDVSRAAHSEQTHGGDVTRQAVRITVPRVPSEADVYRSWRQVLTGVDEKATTGRDTVLGPEVGHGAGVETLPGALVLVVDQHVTGWAQAYHGGKSYPEMDAALQLLLVQADGGLKPLWARHFKTAKGAFGPAALKQLRKYLAAHPPVGDLPVRVTDPGPGRPNLKAGVCRWCGGKLAAHAGVIVGHGPEAELEHNRHCPLADLAQVGTPCGRCGVPVAPSTARVVLVREGTGRREVQHTGRCADHPSLEEYEQQRAAEAEQRAAEKAAEAKREAKRAAAKAKRDAARAVKQVAEREAAEALRARFEALDIVEVTSREELYDKGLNPYGERMRLVEISAQLSDGAPATWWEVEAYGGGLEEPDDRGGRYFLRDDARSEYQQYKYEREPYRPEPRRPRIGDVPCPPGGAKHCAHCGTTTAPAGWMIASLGLACEVDCYTHLANDHGAHARLHH
ncbi:hypothetical protein EV284_6379 [Streptomyces sp. BK022]|uniref:hypothetical protein n=1 Tax=Streptomyces sp. BK022 TaxID=2512123 RepID=UPI00102A8A7C|nr:hypothetical protein [Streptomyces sp. BK022]RZU28213.1 hypothetical protein EV284_6379 [Streptomyces sp. BK022]